MIDHKPLSDEELNQIQRNGATVDDYERLIAQSREANRLRDGDVVLSALAFLAGCFGVGYRVEEIFRLARERGWEQPEECAAARAKRELGELLFREYAACCENDDPWDKWERYTASVSLRGRTIAKHGPTPDAALIAALKAAKEAGR